MKLLTHNLMSSRHIKGVVTGFPLKLTARDVKVSEVDFNKDFIVRILPKLDWEALCQAVESIGQGTDLPRSLDPDFNFEADTEFLKKAHHVLMEVEVVSGELECPETGRKFPITDGIPNMLLNEDEV
ncbi:unnamed protein product [Darwinula stevensoni]|uniref:Multifunctional methyltransferase subunit TRM112-like protein n=1 Tax=Darwinula stevensoni TaxID=69355 RepID=A0A7R8ZZL3_9CRUS|nr:unnamed protein product [Darwinula stevensoni]CAG0883916.1 unnamed protein product [Darwinula stevensoni]